MRVMVTGSGGFIGRYLAAELAQRGHVMVPFGWPALSVLSPPQLAAAAAGADAVIHLAGVLGTAELFDTPRLAAEVNVVGTANVLEACRAAGASYTGITMPPVFPSVYTATKIGARELERAFWHDGLAVSRVRAFNAYGPGQAHGPGHPRKIVPVFASAAWAGEPLPVWGDGEQAVDLIHARDIARLLADAMACGDDVTIDGGTGHGLTVLEVARMVLEITGSRAGVVHLPMRRGEVPSKIAAAGEGWDRLSWRPSFSEADFAAAVESYRTPA